MSTLALARCSQQTGDAWKDGDNKAMHASAAYPIRFCAHVIRCFIRCRDAEKPRIALEMPVGWEGRTKTELISFAKLFFRGRQKRQGTFRQQIYGIQEYRNRSLSFQFFLTGGSPTDAHRQLSRSRWRTPCARTGSLVALAKKTWGARDLCQRRRCGGGQCHPINLGRR